MGITSTARFAAVLVVGILVLGVLSPLVAGTQICLEGDPACCGESGAFAPVLRGAECHCCLTVDALPLDLRAAAQKSFLAAVAQPAHATIAPLPTSTRLARALDERNRPARPVAPSTVVLLI